jgi:hypothetical protein
VSGRRSGTRAALLLVAVGAACGTLEGLDKYAADDPGRDDASMSHPGPGPESGVSADDASDSGSPPPPGDDGGDDASSDAPAVSPPGDAAEASVSDAGSSSCTCVGVAPAGWQGYVQLAWGDAGASGCASPYSVAQNHFIAGVANAPAQCSPCTCLPPPSGPLTCEVELGSAGFLCGGETMTPALQGLCIPTPGGTNGDSYGPTVFPAPATACPVDGGAVTRPPVQTTAATVCAVADAGGTSECSATGEVCVASPPSRSSTVSTKLCIYQAGVQTCPSAYPVTYVVSTAVTDNRGCAACTCAVACPGDGYVQGFTSPNCTGTPAATFAADAGCTLGDNGGGSVSFQYTPSHSAWNGSCAPQGGAPTGAATLNTGSATTFCCMP